MRARHFFWHKCTAVNIPDVSVPLSMTRGEIQRQKCNARSHLGGDY